MPHPSAPATSAHVIAYLAFTLWGVFLGTALGLLLGHHLWACA